jgi:transcriptional regulator with XRE-family HTH domain
MNDDASFAARLRWWRERRSLSQLALAHAANVSQRHVSFLEIGRAAPSRDMVLRLSAALELTFREQNALLLSAGFAPLWRETAFGAPGLALVDRALDFMLDQQEPYPGYVLDRRWNLLRANRAGRELVGFLTGGPFTPDPANPISFADALVAPDALRPLIVNWRDVALYFVRSVRADALADGTEASAALLARLLAYPDVPGIWEAPDEGDEPVLTIHFRKDGVSLRMLTTLATLGTPRDITAQEIRIECFFPADAETADVFKKWAS